MAIVSSGSPLFGVTGLVGNLLFRNINGKTVVSAYRPPKRRKNSKTSELQQMTRSSFTEASRYAKGIMRDPVKYEQYKRKAKRLGLSNAYNAAIKEYMLKGKIECIDTSKVVKKKEFVVRSVKGRAVFKAVEVTLVSRTGKELVKGSAVSLGNGDWRYRYKGEMLDWENVIVSVDAVDVLGNVAMTERPVAYPKVMVWKGRGISARSECESE